MSALSRPVSLLLNAFIYYNGVGLAYGHRIPVPIKFKSFTPSMLEMLNGLTLKDGRYTVTARDCYGNETRSDNVYTIQDTNPIIVGAKSYAVLVRDRNTGTVLSNAEASRRTTASIAAGSPVVRMHSVFEAAPGLQVA